MDGSDLRYDLEIDFEDSVYGADKKILIPKLVSCDRCNASGCEPGSSRSSCKRCGGSGQVTAQQSFFTVRQACPSCQGTGQIIEKPCTGCRGQGRVQTQKTIQLHIPPGVDNGSKLRVTGEGEGGVRGGSTGNLYVVIHIRPHEIFHREGNDILCEVPVPFTIAALGGVVDVPTVTGKARMKIPEGTQNNTVLRLKSKGMPDLRGGSRGDMLVHVVVEVPRNLSREQQQQVMQLANALSESKNYPNRNAFLQKSARFMTGE
jgi:molecular chaperone DnaJ